jgi:hypothetical protein
MTRRNHKVINDGKADHLTVILDLGRQIKGSFQILGGDVVITACLQGAPNEYTEEKF